MQLRITHDTVYRYRRPVTLQPHRLILVPRGTHELGVLASRLDFSPAAEVVWTQDVAGNLVATATFAAPTDRLTISADLTVVLSAPEWPIFRIALDAHAFPFDYAEADVAELGALLHPSHDDPRGALAARARDFVRESPTDTLSLLKDINTGIRDTVAYRAREKEGTQEPLETLSLASGSCRDLSALFVDAVRHLGFGARAVSGYLDDPDASAADAGTTHAWADVYLPGAGWIAFDPTHGRVGSGHLIAVATGRSIERLVPVSGDYLGDREVFSGLDVAVTVRRI